MGGKISPSMMCSDILKLDSELRQFEKFGIEFLHIDVMDGIFVPNIMLGTEYIKKIRQYTSIPLDIHLMVANPEAKLNWFDIRKGDLVSVHYESTPHIHRAIMKIKEKHAKAVLALNPGTPFQCIEELADDLDGVLIMTVDPGFAGQSLVPQTLKKIVETKRWLVNSGHSQVAIEVDGNVSFQNAKKMRKAGADIFVAGTSSIFSGKQSLAVGIEKFRAMIS